MTAHAVCVAAPLPLADESLPLAVVAAPFDDALAHGTACSFAAPLATVSVDWPEAPDHQPVVVLDGADAALPWPDAPDHAPTALLAAE